MELPLRILPSTSLGGRKVVSPHPPCVPIPMVDERAVPRAVWAGGSCSCRHWYRDHLLGPLLLWSELHFHEHRAEHVRWPLASPCSLGRPSTASMEGGDGREPPLGPSLAFCLGEGEEVTRHQLPPHPLRGRQEPPPGVLRGRRRDGNPCPNCALTAQAHPCLAGAYLPRVLCLFASRTSWSQS